MERRWVGGLAFCKMFKFLQTFSLASSNYMILALALERHRVVTRPLAVSSSPYRKVLCFLNIRQTLMVFISFELFLKYFMVINF